MLRVDRVGEGDGPLQQSDQDPALSFAARLDSNVVRRCSQRTSNMRDQANLPLTEAICSCDPRDCFEQASKPVRVDCGKGAFLV